MFWRKWTAEYFVGDAAVDIKIYGNRSIFFSPFRKIYRPKRYAGDDFEFDIFVLRKYSRFNKTMEYYLVDLDDQPELTKQLKEQSNEKSNSEKTSI